MDGKLACEGFGHLRDARASRRIIVALSGRVIEGPLLLLHRLEYGVGRGAAG